MKKILLITLALFMIIPVTNVFAYSGGLLDGKTLNVSANYAVTGTLTTVLTNGNLTDNISLGPDGSSNDAVWYKFDSPQTIAEYQVIASSNLRFVLYDNAGNNLLVSTSISESGLREAITPVENVTYVKFENLNVTSTNISEVDVFSSSATPTEPVIVHSPVTNLTETHSHDTVNLDWTNPIDNADFTGTIVRQNGIEVANLANNISSHTISGLTAETAYTFEVLANYSDGLTSNAESVTVTTAVAPPVEDLPPGNITNVMAEKTTDTVSFVYTLPIDSDFSHLDIYRDGVLLKTNHTLSTFDDVALVPNTSYVYKFVSVDTLGNESSGYTQTVLTNVEVDGTAPVAPTGVIVTAGNASASVMWDASLEADLNGYNVYVDGIKHNTNVIKSTSYVVPNLTNMTTYSITVSAVDTSGNESLKSLAVTVTPDETAMPIFQMKYELKDVADGTASWFSSLWLILAFAVAIPLTFLIARKIKGLFIG